MKTKTIGKMIDEKICIEGLFTTVFHTSVINGQYKFITQGDSSHIAKSPIGMFDEQYIDNDLMKVKEVMVKYYGEEEKDSYEVSTKN